MATLFREQNLKRATNPEVLDEYIRIANPGVWMVIVAIVLLLAAAACWAIFGTVKVDASGVLVVDDGTATLWLDESDASQLAPNAEIEAANAQGLITSSAGRPEAISEDFALASGDQSQLTEGSWVYPFSTAIDLPPGVYSATVVLQSFSPMDLVFNAAQSSSTGGGQSS